MSLRYDLMTARDICVELSQACETNDVAFASASLEGLGKENWGKMLVENREDFLTYLRTTPSQRKRKASWKNSRMQAALAVGALLYAQRAVAYLEIAVALEDSYSSTAREGLAKVAEIVTDREGFCHRLWPFETHNPFEK